MSPSIGDESSAVAEAECCLDECHQVFRQNRDMMSSIFVTPFSKHIPLFQSIAAIPQYVRYICLLPCKSSGVEHLARSGDLTWFSIQMYKLSSKRPYDFPTSFRTVAQTRLAALSKTKPFSVMSGFPLLSLKTGNNPSFNPILL